MDDLRVLVIGTSGSGKSTISKIIHEALNEAGFNAGIVDDDPINYDLQEKRIEALQLKDTCVTIVTRNAIRGGTDGDPEMPYLPEST
jgi:adenylylsulfate kinase-like enzyme